MSARSTGAQSAVRIEHPTPLRLLATASACGRSRVQGAGDGASGMHLVGRVEPVDGQAQAQGTRGGGFSTTRTVSSLEPGPQLSES